MMGNDGPLTAAAATTSAVLVQRATHPYAATAALAAASCSLSRTSELHVSAHVLATAAHAAAHAANPTATSAEAAELAAAALERASRSLATEVMAIAQVRASPRANEQHAQQSRRKHKGTTPLTPAKRGEPGSVPSAPPSSSSASAASASAASVAVKEASATCPHLNDALQPGLWLRAFSQKSLHEQSAADALLGLFNSSRIIGEGARSVGGEPNMRDANVGSAPLLKDVAPQERKVSWPRPPYVTPHLSYLLVYIAPFFFSSQLDDQDGADGLMPRGGRHRCEH